MDLKIILGERISIKFYASKEDRLKALENNFYIKISKHGNDK